MPFQISDIQESDQGVYECRVQISVRESISGTVLLAVRLKPVISDNSTRSDATRPGTARHGTARQTT